MKKINSIKQSPVNYLRWCCSLECGHDQWITAKQKPTRKLMRCQCCDRIVARYHGDIDGDGSLA